MKTQDKKMMEERKKTLLALLKKGGADVRTVEREIALLAIDTVLALRNKAAAKAAGRHFRDIEFAMSGTIRRALNEETRDLINEMLILDELGGKHGPNLTLAFDLAQKIVGGHGNQILAGIKLPHAVAA